MGLPLTVSVPEKAGFVVRETIEANERAVPEARAKFEAALLDEAKAKRALTAAGPAEKAAAEKAARKARDEVALAESAVPLAEAERAALLATIRVEELEDSGRREKEAEAWKAAALEATRAQRWREVLAARQGLVSLAQAVEKARSTQPPATPGDEFLEMTKRAERGDPGRPL